MPRSANAFTFGVVALLAAGPFFGLAGGGDDKQPAAGDHPKAMKRLDTLSDEDLRKELFLAPEIGLDQSTATALYAIIEKTNRLTPAKGVQSDIGVKLYCEHVTTKLKRPDMAAIPWRAGQDCQMGNEAAQRLHVLSTQLRRCLRESAPAGDIRPDPSKLLKTINGTPASATKSGVVPVDAFDPKEWKTPEALSTILQLLQAENSPIREMLIELLAKIDGKEASTALAQRALFDLSPAVREKAIKELGSRPAADFQKTLVDGFRWPWAPVAQHAAEAIAALNLKTAVPELIALLDEPDPKSAFVPRDAKEKLHFVREVVKINHLSNCMLCHAPSFSKSDLVRGRVPIPNEEPPPLYYAETSGLFVRADITYLRQDFSLMQPVTNAKKWPGSQRFDYLLRTRRANAKEMELLRTIGKDGTKPADAPQRQALLFALREVTKLDRGTTSEAWSTLLKAMEKELSPTPEK